MRDLLLFDHHILRGMIFIFSIIFEFHSPLQTVCWVFSISDYSFLQAGQERFQNVHASYYHGAHACIFVFDVTRKQTYKNLETWYQELRQYRTDIPCICVANKIDLDPTATQKKFGFATKYDMNLYFVSAADGRNVVKTFKEAIRMGKSFMDDPKKGDIEDDILELLKD